ncbi:MAG: tautomerase family protein [Bacillota bacterium]|nr:tautomerase family protein [Bacillota bacterium]
MPIVKVSMLEGKSVAYKKKLLDCIHNGLEEAFGIDSEDRFQRIEEYSQENFETASSKSKDFMIIELTIFPGRSREKKREAIERMTEHINSTLQISKKDIFIIFYEPPLENWGMTGKQKE